jgi:hypothetical protein
MTRIRPTHLLWILPPLGSPTTPSLVEWETAGYRKKPEAEEVGRLPDFALFPAADYAHVRQNQLSNCDTYYSFRFIGCGESVHPSFIECRLNEGQDDPGLHRVVYGLNPKLAV